MQQSIDLLKGIASTKDKLSGNMIFLIVFGVIGLLIVISVILLGSRGYINYKYKRNTAILLQEQNRYNQLAIKYPLLAGDTPLVQQVKDVEQQVFDKEQAIKDWEHVVVRRGFSKFMSDLVPATPNDLWLNEIHIDHAINSLTLNGYVLVPESVSRFLNNLKNTSSFKDLIFDLFFVETIKDKSYLKFSIATDVLGDAADHMEVESKTNQD